MKLKDIASQHGFDKDELEDYTRSNKAIPFKAGFTDIVVEDSGVAKLVDNFKQYLADEAEKRAAATRAAAVKAAAEKKATEDKAAAEKKATEDKQTAMVRMLITSGFNFDGYTVVKYSGYISGDGVVQVKRGSFWSGSVNVGEELMKSLVTIRRNALKELKEAAYALGCNAIIGVDFDYLTLDPQRGGGIGGNGEPTIYEPYVFGVTANGNAVVIEKNKTVN